MNNTTSEMSPLAEPNGSQRSLNRRTSSVNQDGPDRTLGWSKSSLSRGNSSSMFNRQQLQQQQQQLQQQQKEKESFTSSLPATPSCNLMTSTGLSFPSRKKSETMHSPMFLSTHQGQVGSSTTSPPATSESNVPSIETVSPSLSNHHPFKDEPFGELQVEDNGGANFTFVHGRSPPVGTDGNTGETFGAVNSPDDRTALLHSINSSSGVSS